MIKSLKLTNVRRFEKAEFDFAPGLNIIIGKNGSGKTTILESIGFLAYGKYLSVAQDSFAISEGAQAGRLELVLEGDVGRVEIGFSAKEKLVQRNGQKMPISHLIGLMPQVFFNPETVELVFDSPALRRRELDMALTQADHRFVSEILSFKKILKERNALLRSVRDGKAKIVELDFWTGKLSQHALYIYSGRKQLVEFLNKNIGSVFADLSELKDHLSLKYIPSADYDRFDEVLMAHQEGDIESGLTSVGPHRDDFVFMLEKHSMREGSSRGEQRLAAVAFKALASEFLISKGIDPVIMLDDVFSELDRTRQAAVAQALKLFNVKQVFLSSTDEDLIPQELIENSNIIRL